MIETVFVEGEGDFVDPDDWQALIDPEHAALPPGSGQAVFVGLDLATAPKGDDAALIDCEKLLGLYSIKDPPMVFICHHSSSDFAGSSGRWHSPPP